MRGFRFIAVQSGAALLSLGLILLVGCGDDGFGRRYPVSGKVSVKGVPLEHGRISFEPEPGKEGRVASGEIENGAYTLTTHSPGDGALPGSYRVTIVAKDVNNDNVVKNAGGGAGRQDDIYKAEKAAKRLVPAKYELAETSGLKAEVGEKTNTFDFDVTD